MLNKINFSLWDLLTFFSTGVIILLNSILYGSLEYLKSLFLIGIIESEVIIGIYYIVIAYTLGVIFEPISNFIFRFFDRIYPKLPFYRKIKGLAVESEIYEKIAKEVLIRKLGIDNKSIDYYQFAKNFLVQRNVNTVFMIYLSRFGFYRNLFALVLLNIIYLPFNYGRMTHLLFWFVLALSISLQFLIYKRCKEFYYYAGNEIYRNFILLQKANYLKD